MAPADDCRHAWATLAARSGTDPAVWVYTLPNGVRGRPRRRQRAGALAHMRAALFYLQALAAELTEEIAELKAAGRKRGR